MAVKNNQSKIIKLPEKLKEKEKLKKQEEQKPNPIETIIRYLVIQESLPKTMVKFPRYL